MEKARGTAEAIMEAYKVRAGGKKKQGREKITQNRVKKRKEKEKKKKKVL